MGKNHDNGLGEAEMPEGYPSRDDRSTVGYLDLPLWGQAEVGAHITSNQFKICNAHFPPSPFWFLKLIRQIPF